MRDSYGFTVKRIRTREEALREISRLLRAARDESGLSQDDFSEGITSQSNYSKIERGEFAPDPGQIARLAEKYPKLVKQKRLLELAAIATGYVETDAAEGDEQDARERGLLPVVGVASCGSWMEAIDEGRQPTGELRTEEQPAPLDYRLRDKKHAFWVVARGDSMTGWNSRIEDNDLLLVEPHAPLVDGKCALVQLDGKVTVKEWHDNGNSIVLIPTNPKYRPMSLSKSEFAERGGRAFRITFIKPHPREL